MADKKRFTLYYGGEKFILTDDQKDALDGVAGQEGLGMLTLELSSGGWLTIVTGPGIPIALEEVIVKPPKVRVATF